MSYCKLGPMTLFFFFFFFGFGFGFPSTMKKRKRERKRKENKKKEIKGNFIFASWKILKAEVYADISRDPRKWWAWE